MKPQRWTHRPPAGEPLAPEDRAARLLRGAVVAEPLDADARARVWERLPDERRPAPRRLVLRFGLALALFLSGGGVVLSATLLRGWTPSRPATAPTPVAPPSRPRAALGPPPAPTPTAVEPTTEPPPPAVPAPRARIARAAALEPPPVEPAPPTEAPTAPVAVPTPPSAIAEEARLVAGALRRLREQDDAAGALALLDERDARFGARGALGDEVRTTRVEALLRLGQRERALALLDVAMLRPTGRDRALLATRGELRADRGACRDAVADFDALLLDDDAADNAAERALYGRAACRARAGESDAARADLEAYVARFPDGRHAARARAALESER
jgi:hypothetical protein